MSGFLGNLPNLHLQAFLVNWKRGKSQAEIDAVAGDQSGNKRKRDDGDLPDDGDEDAENDGDLPDDGDEDAEDDGDLPDDGDVDAEDDGELPDVDDGVANAPIPAIKEDSDYESA